MNAGGCKAKKKQKGHKRQQPSATEMFVIVFWGGEEKGYMFM